MALSFVKLETKQNKKLSIRVCKSLEVCIETQCLSLEQRAVGLRTSRVGDPDRSKPCRHLGLGSPAPTLIFHSENDQNRKACSTGMSSDKLGSPAQFVYLRQLPQLTTRKALWDRKVETRAGGAEIEADFRGCAEKCPGQSVLRG